MNGVTTHIWVDNWRPYPNCGHIIPDTALSQYAPQFIHEIIDPQAHKWMLADINCYLNLDTMNLIRKIPIGDTNQSDQLVWPWTSYGNYSVSSGYHILLSQHQHIAMRSNHSSYNIDNCIWEQIWRIKTLPKIHMFCWRILGNAFIYPPQSLQKKDYGFFYVPHM